MKDDDDLALFDYYCLDCCVSIRIEKNILTGIDDVERCEHCNGEMKLEEMWT